MAAGDEKLKLSLPAGSCQPSRAVGDVISSGQTPPPVLYMWLCETVIACS